MTSFLPAMQSTELHLVKNRIKINIEKLYLFIYFRTKVDINHLRRYIPQPFKKIYCTPRIIS